MSVSFNDIELAQFFGQLNLRERLRMLRGVYRREARRVRAVAVSNLRATGLRVRGNRADWEKGIYTEVYTRAAGFKVSIFGQRNGRRGMHLNRAGLTKPVLTFFEKGTAARHTKSASRFGARQRRGHATGRVRRYAFMRKAGQQVAASVSNNIRTELRANMQRIAQRHGFI